MSLLAYNRTTSPVTIVGTTTVLPPSAFQGYRGASVNVTNVLKNKTQSFYEAIEIQQAEPQIVELEWSGATPEYNTVGLSTIGIAQGVVVAGQGLVKVGRTLNMLPNGRLSPNAVVYYCVDYETGNDANVAYFVTKKKGHEHDDCEFMGGLSDLAAAAAKPLKTFEELSRRFPRDGVGSSAVVLIKPRPAGAVYLKQDGVTPDDLDFLDTTHGYEHVVVRGSHDFSNSASDKVRCGGIVPAGLAATYTVASTDGILKITLGTALPEESAYNWVAGYRIRIVTPSSALPARQDFCAMVTKVYPGGTDIEVSRLDLMTYTQLIQAGDVVAIERPGVTVNSLGTGTLNPDYSVKVDEVVSGDPISLAGIAVLNDVAFSAKDATVSFCCSGSPELSALTPTFPTVQNWAIKGSGISYPDETGTLYETGAGIRFNSYPTGGIGAYGSTSDCAVITSPGSSVPAALFFFAEKVYGASVLVREDTSNYSVEGQIFGGDGFLNNYVRNVGRAQFAGFTFVAAGDFSTLTNIFSEHEGSAFNPYASLFDISVGNGACSLGVIFGEINKSPFRMNTNGGQVQVDPYLAYTLALNGSYAGTSLPYAVVYENGSSGGNAVLGFDELFLTPFRLSDGTFIWAYANPTTGSFTPTVGAIVNGSIGTLPPFRALRMDAGGFSVVGAALPNANSKRFAGISQGYMATADGYNYTFINTSGMSVIEMGVSISSANVGADIFVPNASATGLGVISATGATKVGVLVSALSSSFGLVRLTLA